MMGRAMGVLTTDLGASCAGSSSPLRLIRSLDMTLTKQSPCFSWGRRRRSFCFGARRWLRLRNLQAKLSRPALAGGGPSRKAVEKLLLDACQHYVDEGADAGVSSLETKLAEPQADCPGDRGANRDVYLPVERALALASSPESGPRVLSLG